VEDLVKDASYDIRHTVGVDSIPVAAPVTVLIAAEKALPEVVLITWQIDVTRVPVGRILERELVPIAERGPVQAVGLSGPEPFLVAWFNCLPQVVRGKVIDVIVPAASIVPVPGRGVKARSKDTAVSVSTQPREVILFKAPALKPASIPQLALPLLDQPVAIGVAATNVIKPPLPVSIDLLLIYFLLDRPRTPVELLRGLALLCLPLLPS